MSWWDFSWSDVGDFASDAWDFAKANPELTGAVVGGLADGGKGALIGAGVGYGLSNLAPGTFGGGSYSLPRINEWGSTPTGTYGTGSVGGAPSQYSLAGGTGSSYGLQPTGTAGLQTGSFTPGAGSSTGVDYSLTSAPSVGNAGVTGDFGSYGTKVEAGLGKVASWGQENPRLASALVQGVGALSAMSGQRKANKLMEQQLGQQQQQFDKSNAMADYWNTQSRQSGDEARSLYNPQELAVRGMAQQVASTGRQEQAARSAALKRGMTPAEAEAEARRVRLAGSTNATTGYLAGLDTGRGAQQSALSSAKGLSMGYGMPADTSAAAAGYRTSATNTAAGLQSMLERYLGQPSTQLEEEARRKKQEGSIA